MSSVMDRLLLERLAVCANERSGLPCNGFGRGTGGTSFAIPTYVAVQGSS